MGQLAYLAEGDPSADLIARSDGLALTLSLFGDAGALRTLMADAESAGLSVRGARSLESLLDSSAGVLGDVVVVDCPSPGGAQLAALIRLDERSARAGAQLVVSTSAAALDDVFGCLERSGAQILVDPTAAQRVLALGAALARLSGNRVRELDEEGRLAVLRLTEEVGRLAAKIDLITAGGLDGRLESAGRDVRAAGERDRIRQIQPPLPDPRLVKLIIRQRRLRDRYFDAALFADPAWDILLDLTIARVEHRRVPVTSLCIAAAVPLTTALRWIAQMTEMGLLIREQDEGDKRRAFIALSDKAADAMARYFYELDKAAARLI